MRDVRAISTRALTGLLAAALLAVGGCGGEDGPPQPDIVPAAGQYTPPSGTPGVPEGSPYDVDGNGWRKLSSEEQLAAAEKYVDQHRSLCEGADPQAVADFVSASVGTDYALYTPAADVLSEGCTAALSS